MNHLSKIFVVFCLSFVSLNAVALKIETSYKDHPLIGTTYKTSEVMMVTKNKNDKRDLSSSSLDAQGSLLSLKQKFKCTNCWSLDDKVIDVIPKNAVLVIKKIAYYRDMDPVTQIADDMKIPFAILSYKGKDYSWAPIWLNEDKSVEWPVAADSCKSDRSCSSWSYMLDKCGPDECWVALMLDVVDENYSYKDRRRHKAPFPKAWSEATFKPILKYLKDNKVKYEVDDVLKRHLGFSAKVSVIELLNFLLLHEDLHIDKDSLTIDPRE